MPPDIAEVSADHARLLDNNDFFRPELVGR